MIRFVWGERAGEWRYFGICDGRDGLWFVGVRRAEGCFRATRQQGKHAERLTEALRAKASEHRDGRLAALERAERLAEALRIAEAALADIGDADREPGDNVAWCERRAAEPLPMIRALLRDQEGGK